MGRELLVGVCGIGTGSALGSWPGRATLGIGAEPGWRLNPVWPCLRPLSASLCASTSLVPRHHVSPPAAPPIPWTEPLPRRARR